jgi:membrane protease YdiL (CAAX protease family)
LESTGVVSGTEPEHGRLRRLAEITIFIAIWIAIGEVVFDAEQHQETYLLIGIPLVAIFQLGVRRKRIPEMWVRGAPSVVRRRLTVTIAVAVAVYPAVSLVQAIADADSLALVLYSVAAVVGAGAAGYAFGHFTRATWRYLVYCVAPIAAFAVVQQEALKIAEHFSHPTVTNPDQDVLIGLTSFLLYMGALFMIEEVVFRGCLDSHVHHPGEHHGVLSALYVSILWTVWHVPVYGIDALAAGTTMIPIGILLSIFWRKSGNLGVSGTAHAVNDAIRNAYLGGAP